MDTQESPPKVFFKCSLPQCSGLRFNLVHKFPRTVERAKLWLQAFDIPRLNAIPHSRLVHLNVCCRHFRVEDYVHSTARSLNYVAVPSLNLKELNELNKCRQTEIEKANTLTVDETNWLKNQDIQEYSQNPDIPEQLQVESNLVMISPDKTFSTPEVLPITKEILPVASNKYPTPKATIISPPKVQHKSNSMEEQKSPPKLFFKCALPQCSGLRFNLVHRFPRLLKRAKLWLQAFDVRRLNTIPHSRLLHLNVCCRHFRVEDYVHPTSRSLNYVAVPSLNLKQLNELNKCRQTEIEKANKLTVDEMKWFKNQDIQEYSQSQDTTEDLEVESNLVIISPDKIFSTPEVIATTKKGFPVVSVSKTFPTPKAAIITPPKVRHKQKENVVSPTINIQESSPEDPNEDFQLIVNEGFLNIVDSKWDTSIRLDVLWLRSICRCSICYNDVECIPNTIFFNLPIDLQAIMATVTEESRLLEIIWSDGHTSTYNLIDLYQNFLSKPLSTKSNDFLLWTSQHQAYCDDLKPLKFYDILTNQNAIYTALDRLQKSGILIIREIPKCDKDSVVKKSIISKMFNHLWDNLITEKRSKFFQHQSTPFTNCTFESMDKGLQILTIPYYKKYLKLELRLVDGFQAVTQLSKTTSEFLSQTAMDFGFTSKQGYKCIVKHTVLTKGEHMERIMYLPYHLENLKSEDYKIVSMHLKQFHDILNLKDNQWNVELTTDTMIILDNYRICWCLYEPHKDTELDCFYLERKHYLCSLNALKGNMKFK